jgi:hypothetical protein
MDPCAISQRLPISPETSSNAGFSQSEQSDRFFDLDGFFREEELSSNSHPRIRTLIREFEEKAATEILEKTPRTPRFTGLTPRTPRFTGLTPLTPKATPRINRVLQSLRSEIDSFERTNQFSIQGSSERLSNLQEPSENLMEKTGSIGKFLTNHEESGTEIPIAPEAVAVKDVQPFAFRKTFAPRCDPQADLPAFCPAMRSHSDIFTKDPTLPQEPGNVTHAPSNKHHSTEKMVGKEYSLEDWKSEAKEGKVSNGPQQPRNSAFVTSNNLRHLAEPCTDTNVRTEYTKADWVRNVYQEQNEGNPERGEHSEANHSSTGCVNYHSMQFVAAPAKTTITSLAALKSNSSQANASSLDERRSSPVISITPAYNFSQNTQISTFKNSIDTSGLQDTFKHTTDETETLFPSMQGHTSTDVHLQMTQYTTSPSPSQWTAIGFGEFQGYVNSEPKPLKTYYHDISKVAGARALYGHVRAADDAQHISINGDDHKRCAQANASPLGVARNLFQAIQSTPFPRYS